MISNLRKSLQKRSGVEVFDVDAEGAAGEAAFVAFFVELVPDSWFVNVLTAAFYVDRVVFVAFSEWKSFAASSWGFIRYRSFPPQALVFVAVGDEVLTNFEFNTIMRRVSR